jgi:hypothetical protein
MPDRYSKKIPRTVRRVMAGIADHISDWKLWAALAGCLFGAALLVALLVIVRQLDAGKTRATCRQELEANVDFWQAEHELWLGNGLAAFAQDDDAGLDDAVIEQQRAAVQLRAALEQQQKSKELCNG